MNDSCEKHRPLPRFLAYNSRANKTLMQKHSHIQIRLTRPLDMNTSRVISSLTGRYLQGCEPQEQRESTVDIFKRKTSELMPPYGGYGTHLDLLERLSKGGVPSKLRPNPALQGNLTDTIYSQQIRGWRFFGLANVDEEPTAVLHALVDAKVNAKVEEYQKILRLVIHDSYNFLFGPDASPLDLAEATAEELSRRFEQQGISGSTIRRSVLFFVRMAQDAGMSLSDDIVGDQGVAMQENSSMVGHVNGQATARGNLASQFAPPTTISSRTRPLSELLLEKLPTFDAMGSPEERKAWLDSYSAIVRMIEREQKPGAI